MESDRKILNARRRKYKQKNNNNQTNFCPAYNNTPNNSKDFPQKSTDNFPISRKRKASIDSSEGSLLKKRNSNRDNYVSTPKTSKNIAARRLQNLRNSLQMKVSNENYSLNARSSKSGHTPQSAPNSKNLNTPVTGCRTTTPATYPGCRSKTLTNFKDDLEKSEDAHRCFDRFSYEKSFGRKHPTKVQETFTPANVEKSLKLQTQRVTNVMHSNQIVHVCASDASTSFDVDIVDKFGPDSLPKDKRDASLLENMDWSPINEDEIIQNLNIIRENILSEKSTSQSSTLAPKSPYVGTYSTKELYIVVDSNIFLLNLSFVSKLELIQVKNYENVIIFVPWIVLEELDYIKNGQSGMRNLQKSAQRAVKYINSKLSQKSARFRGQTILDVSRVNLSSSNPDDSILFCCMQLIERNNNVILLSNDINLRNKALVHNVVSHSHTEIVEKLNSYNDSPDNSKPKEELSISDLKIVLNNLLSLIITQEAKKCFGEVWLKVIHVKPPFSLEESLANIKKHWISVFSFRLQKQCKLCVEDFLEFVNNQNDYELSRDLYNKFVEFALRLCVFLKNGYHEYRDKINSCVSMIQKYAE